jgi:hypothetical protein
MVRQDRKWADRQGQAWSCEMRRCSYAVFQDMNGGVKGLWKQR